MSTTPDQQFFDILHSLKSTVLQTSSGLIGAVERQIDDLALQIRDNLSSAAWLPPQARPSPPPPPPRIPLSALALRGDESLIDAARRIASEHAAVTAAVVAFVGTGGVMLWRRRSVVSKRRRKARRALNKARKEAVVATGAFGGGIASAVLLDLERRDFIVYVVVCSDEEAEDVKQFRNQNIRPLRLDLSDATSTEEAVSNFTASLHSSIHPAQSVRITGLVVIPSATSTAAAHSLSSASSTPATQATGAAVDLQHLTPSTLSDALNTSVLYPITIIRALLPSLKAHTSRIVLLTPSVSPSLSPAQSLMSTVGGALDAFSAALAAELRPLDIPVVQLKLGKFQLDARTIEGTQIRQQLVPYGARPEPKDPPLSWRKVFALGGLSGSGGGGVGEGSPMRELNEAVFDALERPGVSGGVWRAGRGSWIYGVVEALAPWGSMRWRLGLRAAAMFNGG